MQQPISYNEQLFPNKLISKQIKKHLEGSVIVINRDFALAGWTMGKNDI